MTLLDIIVVLAGTGLVIFLFRQHLKAKKELDESMRKLERSIREWEEKENQ